MIGGQRIRAVFLALSVATGALLYLAGGLATRYSGLAVGLFALAVVQVALTIASVVMDDPASDAAQYRRMSRSWARRSGLAPEQEIALVAVGARRVVIRMLFILWFLSLLGLVAGVVTAPPTADDLHPVTYTPVPVLHPPG